jgi:transposase
VSRIVAGYSSFLNRLSRMGSEVRLGVESTGNTRYFKNRMEEAGHEVITINTVKFKVVKESVKKTDKHDAGTIADRKNCRRIQKVTGSWRTA